MSRNLPSSDCKLTLITAPLAITLKLIWFTLPLANPATSLETETRSRLVIVIDDIGHQRSSAEAALALPGHLTLALLPFTPYSKEIALKAIDFEKEVILHSPMSAISAYKNPGPGALTFGQGKKNFVEILNNQLDFVPEIRGLSNHMGSALTSKKIPMQWLMEQLKSRNLYFLDSRTTYLSKAAKIAEEKGVPYLERKFFLDNVVSRSAIEKQIDRSVNYAKKNGLAVAIGHPYPETLMVLSEILPEIQNHGVNLVWASEAIEKSQNIRKKNRNKTLIENRDNF